MAGGWHAWQETEAPVEKPGEEFERDARGI
jgi:hypothetical protein